MNRFRIFLIANPQPVEIDLAVRDVNELHDIASRSRFLEGYLTEPDGDGVCAGVLIPTGRIHLIIETS